MRKQGKQWQTIFLGSKITANGDCCHEIKKCLLLGRKAMRNLDSVLKLRDITLPTKVGLVKAMIFGSPVWMLGFLSAGTSKSEGSSLAWGWKGQQLSQRETIIFFPHLSETNWITHMGDVWFQNFRTKHRRLLGRSCPRRAQKLQTRHKARSTGGQQKWLPCGHWQSIQGLQDRTIPLWEEILLLWVWSRASTSPPRG